MKRLLYVGTVLILLLAGACSENQPAQSSERLPAPAVSAVQISAQPAAGADSRSLPAAVSGSPAPPPGAEWTIFCTLVRGPDHVLVANRAKEDLVQQTHMGGWHLIHHEEDSILYYGYYTELGTPRAKADKHAIEALTTPKGDREFPASQFVPLSSPNPTAPPEWDLANTPPDMYWSLQIAAFCQTPDHWERAVKAARDFRGEGVEAYYYHTDAMSIVCVGAWPRTAVRQQNAGGVAHNNNANTPIVVANQEIPDGAVPRLHDANGNPVPVIAPKLVVDDPTLQKMIAQFPENAVNGWVMTQKDKLGKDVPAASFLVEIPHSDASLKGHAADADQQPPAQAVPADGTDATLGKLQTIGGH